MKFPVTVKHRRAEATIYGKTPGNRTYRFAYYAEGRRLLRNFPTYRAELREAKRVVRDLARGNHDATALSQRDAHGYQ